MTFRPAVLSPTPPPLLPTSATPQPQVPRGGPSLPLTPSDVYASGGNAAAAGATSIVYDRGWRGPLRPGVQALKRVVVHGSLQVAASTAPGAVLLDLAAPVGPSAINPLGQAYGDAPLYALFCLLLSNGIVAPLCARSVLRMVANSSTRGLARPDERRSAAWHGGLGAAIAVVAAVLGCVRLQEEITHRGAVTGWEQGAFPNMYYWRALSYSAQACVPLLALLGYHAASNLRGWQLLGVERFDGMGLLELPPQL